MTTFDGAHDGVCEITLGTCLPAGKPITMHIDGETGNIAVVGRVGSGKSFAMKLITKRLADACPSAAIFVFDPMNEYGRNAQYYGLDAVFVDGSVPEFGDRSIIAPKSQLESASEALAGALEKAWERVSEMPHDALKAIVIDDVRILLGSPKGQKVIGEIMRSGRKSNVVLLLSVQRLQDINVDRGAENGPSGNMDAFIFMQQLDAYAISAKRLGADNELLSKLLPGLGLLISKDHCVCVRFVATKDETEMYFPIGAPA